MTNISATELPVLAEASLEINEDDMDKVARDIETMDIMLGVLKMKSLINSRDRKAASRWSRGRNLSKILENVILRENYD